MLNVASKWCNLSSNLSYNYVMLDVPNVCKLSKNGKPFSVFNNANTIQTTTEKLLWYYFFTVFLQFFLLFLLSSFIFTQQKKFPLQSARANFSTNRRIILLLSFIFISLHFMNFIWSPINLNVLSYIFFANVSIFCFWFLCQSIRCVCIFLLFAFIKPFCAVIWSMKRDLLSKKSATEKNIKSSMTKFNWKWNQICK